MFIGRHRSPKEERITETSWGTIIPPLRLTGCPCCHLLKRGSCVRSCLDTVPVCRLDNRVPVAGKHCDLHAEKITAVTRNLRVGGYILQKVVIGVCPVC